MTLTPAIELNALPHAQAAALAATGVPVYLSVNPIEYHGPHLSLYNDYLLSVAVAEDLHCRIQQKHPEWPLVFAAPLHLGVDPTPGRGSVAHSYRAVKQAVLAACAGLAALGVKRVIIMTFHGSPMHALALQAGVEELRRLGIQAFAPFNFVLEKMLSYRTGDFEQALRPLADAGMRQTIDEQLGHDFHAGFFETSLILHYRPQAVDPAFQQLAPCAPVTAAPGFMQLARLANALGRTSLARELQLAAQGTGWLKQQPFVGYTGWPHLANAQSGAAFAEVILELYLKGFEAALLGGAGSPEPTMKWVRTLSLGGRLVVQ